MIRNQRSQSPRRRRSATVLIAGMAALVAAALVVSAGAGAHRPVDRVPDAAQTAAAPCAARVDRTNAREDGAVAAAADYATLLARLLPLDRGQARRVVADVASANHWAALVAAVDAELAPLQAKAASLPGSTLYRQSVLATRVLSMTPPNGITDAPRARVAVWTLVTIGRSKAREAAQSNPLARFMTLNLDLVYERGAWRLDRTTQQVGPTPLLDGEPQPAEDLGRALDGFTDWRPA